ncbi:delta-like protein 4 [Orbicella faveolata]|uniref:delta-like protein 4 n=1 Tax=Orbicella faveolata TaxID=48498 RepID=UPI0009E4A827|nr:delta-like protein 4 [Orbicella faveolata]
MESRCMSINIGPVINDKVICELSNSDHSLHPDDLKARPGFTYTGTENACSSNPCVNNGTCLSGFTDKNYHCVCPAYLTGENCDKGKHRQ